MSLIEIIAWVVFQPRFLAQDSNQDVSLLILVTCTSGPRTYKKKLENAK